MYKPGWGRFNGRIIKGHPRQVESQRDRLLRNLRPAAPGLSSELRNWRLYRRMTQAIAGQRFGVTGAEISIWEREGVPPRRIREVRTQLALEAQHYNVSFSNRNFRQFGSEPYSPFDPITKT